MVQIDYFAKMKGFSPGTLHLIQRELRSNPEFARHLKNLLSSPDPQKAVFEDMLQTVQLYVRGEDLPDWLWWDLIDDIERFVDKEDYIPQKGDEGSLLMRSLSVNSIDAAKAKKTYDNLPWKKFNPVKIDAGMNDLGISWRTPAQIRKHHRHNRQRRLAAATPEERENYLRNKKARKEHKKRKSLGKKFNAAYREYGGIVGNVVSAIGGIVAVFAPIGTVIGAGLIIAGVAVSAHAASEVARVAAKAREREMNAIQDDFETGEITEEEHKARMKIILEEEAAKLAAEGKLPPNEPDPDQVQTEGMPATKENIAKMIYENKTPEKIIIPEASNLVKEENQYVIDQAGKMEEPVAVDSGLAPAKEIAQAQETTKKAVPVALVAAGAVPFLF